MTLHKRDTPDDLITAELSRDRNRPSGPDFTGAIMSELGYERTDERTRQRRRRRWLVMRCLTAAALFGALMTGYTMHQEHGDVRQASTRSVPDAISQDLLRHQNHLDDVMHMFRDFTVPASLFVPDDRGDAGDPGGSPAVVPADVVEPPATAAPPAESTAPADADEADTSQNASGPYRWV